MSEHVKRNDPSYITPNHYYGNKYALIEVLEDQLSPEGYIGFNKFLCIKYLLGAENNSSALRRLTKAKYYLDELTIYKEKQAKDKNVNEEILSPKYYHKGNFEVIDIIEDELTDEEIFGAYVGVIMRYITREARKNGLEDCKKAQYYLNRLIKRLKEKGQNIEKLK